LRPSYEALEILKKAVTQVVTSFLSDKGFSPDIFVSYSHIDNEPFGVNDPHWVSQFHHYLEIRVRQLGRRVTIWRDNKTDGTDVFSDKTLQQLRRSAILVSIVTPNYVQSDWCKRELDAFIEAAANTGGLRIGNKIRIVKVLKTPVERRQLPEILDTMLGYQFYAIEPDSEAMREFLIDPGAKGGAAYFAKLDDVAQEIERLIDLIAAAGMGCHFGPQLGAAARPYRCGLLGGVQC
jgi:TIR domain